MLQHRQWNSSHRFYPSTSWKHMVQASGTLKIKQHTKHVTWLPRCNAYSAIWDDLVSSTIPCCCSREAGGTHETCKFVSSTSHRGLINIPDACFQAAKSYSKFTQPTLQRKCRISFFFLHVIIQILKIVREMPLFKSKKGRWEQKEHYGELYTVAIL